MPDYLYIDLDVDSQFYVVRSHRDYDGNRLRSITMLTRGKGFNSCALDSLELKDFGLLIPCDRSVTAAIDDFLGLQCQHVEPTREGSEFKGPYYFTMDMTRDQDFEASGAVAPLFGGPDTAYAPALNDGTVEKQSLLWRLLGWPREDFNHNRATHNPDNLRLARYNCWTAGQGITQYVGGVDLSKIHPEFASVFRVYDAMQIHADLVNDLKDGTAPDYEFIAKPREELLLARRGAFPPFILVDEKIALEDALAAPMPDGRSTVESFLETQKPFTCTPANAHLHMTAKLPEFKP